jgi:tetratricopeptide (TPR) repeat protein
MIFFEKTDYPAVVKPDGPLFRWGSGELGRWVEPIPAEYLLARFRRARGQFVERTATEVRVHPEPYEKRLLRVLLLARKNKADALAKRGDLAEASRLYDTLFALDPELNREPTVLFQAAILDIGGKQLGRADERFKRSLDLGLEGEPRARACYFLFALTASVEWKAKALASPDLAPELRAKLEGR